MKENIPKYVKVQNYFIDKIAKGDLKVGEQIETEAELAELFGFSRMTINKALNGLVEKNYIYRISGRGSYVKNSHVDKQLTPQIASFTDDMRSIGMEAGSELLTYELVKADSVPKIKEKLGIVDNIFLHYFVRLRTGDNVPVAISYNYVSTEVLPMIDINELNGSFFGYLRKCGYEILNSEIEIGATLPTKEQKKLLEINNNALLKTSSLTQVLYKNNEHILGYFDTYYNGNMYTYTFNQSI